MSSIAKIESVPSAEDEVFAKEARRLYSTMFGKLLEDDDETPSLICDRIFLGSAPDARNLEKLQRHHIKYVLNMTGSTSYPVDFFTASGHSHIILLTLDTHDEDNYDISSHFPVALDFIRKSLNTDDEAVLVHCAAGVSRSATIVAAYLIATYHIGATEAVLRVNQARPCACPNIGFLQQLLRFERTGFKF
ncbi:unnamed protein product [Rotaria magnacalcarata]